MKIIKTVVGIVLGATALFAQNPPRPSFEVASIRPSVGTPQGAVAAGARTDGAQFRTAYLTLKDYIAMAYRLKLYQVSGPDWIGQDRFDVIATLSDGRGCHATSDAKFSRSRVVTLNNRRPASSRMAERTSARSEDLSMDQSSLVYGIVVCKRIFFISEPVRHPGSDVITSRPGGLSFRNSPAKTCVYMVETNT